MSHHNESLLSYAGVAVIDRPKFFLTNQKREKVEIGRYDVTSGSSREFPESDRTESNRSAG